MTKFVETIFEPKIYHVPSETDPTKTYDVSHTRPTKWTCTCRDFVYRSKTPDGFAVRPAYKCKHIKDKIRELSGELE